MDRQIRTRLVTATVVAVVFGAGVLIGLAADSNLGAEPPETSEVEQVAEVEEERERRRPLYSQLGPSEEQQAVIDSIISVHRERTNALDKETRQAYRRGFREILLETRQAIKEVFPPDVGAEYQRLLDDYDAQQAAEREDRERRP